MSNATHSGLVAGPSTSKNWRTKKRLHLLMDRYSAPKAQTVRHADQLIATYATLRRKTVANSKSAAKRMRQTIIRRDRNRMVRSRLRTCTSHFERAVASGDVAQAEEQFRSAEAALDRAASKGVIPKSRASRKTSRMAQSLEKLRANA
ncbi:MAG: 30S ribosomal protein S20 [Bradymonadaceae bacterium]